MMKTPVARSRRRSPIMETGADRVFGMIIHLLCALALFSVLYPLYFVVIASFSDSDMVNTGQVLLWPKGFSTYGYAEVWKDSRIWSGYANTLIYTIGGTFVNMVCTCLAAYPLSIKAFSGRRIINAMFVFTMFFGGGLVPTYMLISSLGLVNNRLVMIVPFCVNVFNLIIMRTSFEGIPKDLYEASMLDGCSHFVYFVKIVLPLSMAVLSVITLYYMVGHWNDFFTALLYLNRDTLTPLQIVLRSILLSNQTFASGATGGTGMSYAQRYADQVKYVVIIVSTLPIIIVYPFVQKYFEKGVMVGAIKG